MNDKFYPCLLIEIIDEYIQRDVICFDTEKIILKRDGEKCVWNLSISICSFRTCCHEKNEGEKEEDAKVTSFFHSILLR